MTEYGGLLATAIGALIGAAAVLTSQYFTNRQQERLQAQRIAADTRLKLMDFERLDRGVRSQVSALVSQVGKFVLQCGTQSGVDWTKMEPPLKRLLDRIYMPDVANALTPSQAGALYEAAGSIELAYRFSLQQPWGRPGEKFDAFEAREQVKATYKEPCETIAFFWHEMDDEMQAQTFKTAAETGRRYPDPTHRGT
jgi:hypothetical protein